MSLSWKDWLMPKQNDSIMLSPNKDRTIAEIVRGNVLANTQPSKSVETQNQNNIAKTQAKTAASAATPQKQEKKVNMFQPTEPTRTSSPLFRNTYDWQKDPKERMQKYGIDLLSQNKNTAQPPAMIIKTDPEDEDAEEFTPAGEKAFLEGFNSIYNDDVPDTPLTKAQSAVHTAKKKHDKISFLGNLPLKEKSYKWGPYQYNDRYLTEAQNRYKPGNSKNGLYAPEKPAGRLGIALRDLPEIADVSGKNQVNYIFGLDTKYSDQNGNLQSSTVPNWVFNRDAIKQHNVDMIDKATDKLMYVTPESKKGALFDIADSLKQNQAIKVDESATYFEGKFNSAVEDSFKNKTNRAIAEAAENMPKIVNSDAVKILKTGGKAVAVAGDVLQIVETGLKVYEDYQDDNKLGKQSVKEIVGAVGDFGGAALGAKAGAALLGAIAGVASGGVLAAPAMAVGGILGGIFGGRMGEKIAEGAVELFV